MKNRIFIVLNISKIHAKYKEENSNFTVEKLGRLCFTQVIQVNVNSNETNGIRCLLIGCAEKVQ